MKIILLISSIILSSCATTGKVTLGEMKIYGSNENWIYTPIKE